MGEDVGHGSSVGCCGGENEGNGKAARGRGGVAAASEKGGGVLVEGVADRTVDKGNGAVAWAPLYRGLPFCPIWGSYPKFAPPLPFALSPFGAGNFFPCV